MSSQPQSTRAVDAVAAERRAYRHQVVQLFAWALLSVSLLTLAAFWMQVPARERLAFFAAVVLGLVTVGLSRSGRLLHAVIVGIGTSVVLLGWTTLFVPHSELTPVYLVVPAVMASIVLECRGVRLLTVGALWLTSLAMRVGHHLIHQPDLDYSFSLGFDGSLIFALVLGATELHRRRRERDFALLEDALAHNEELVQTAQRSAEAARQANDHKSAFLERVSHELRTPLNVILGYAEMLDEDELVDPEGREDLGRIHTAGQQLLALVDDLLDLTSVEQGDPVVRQEVWLDALLEEVVDAIGPMAAHHGNEVVVSAAPPLPVQLDRGRVKRILVNLAHNAARFTDDGTIELAAELHDSAVVFTVLDDGIGIDGSRLPRLFEPFVQGSADTKYDRGGTGLGLALCDRAVRQLGGHIDVRSRLGVGSCFTVTVPLPRDDRRPLMRADAPSPLPP
jgi:signal transduction histidine kinase